MKRFYFLQCLTIWLFSTSLFSQVTEPNVTTVSLDIYHNYHVSGEVNRVVSTFFLPKNISNKQRIIKINSQPPPNKVYKSGGNQYIEFVFDEPQNKFVLNIQLDIELYRYDLATATDNQIKSSSPFPEGYLRNEMFLRKENKRILEIADTIKGKSRLETVQNIYDFVVNHLEYNDKIRENIGAIKALKKGEGDCTEYADLFVTLCRAKEIPARVVTGCIAEHSANPNHHWAEVFMGKLGWIPFDPTFGDSQAAQFNQLPNKYIYYSNQRRDKVLFTGNGNHKWWLPQRNAGDVYVKSFYDVSSDLEDKFGHVEALFNDNQIEEADSLINELLEYDPKSSRYHALKGLILSKSKGFIEACQALQEAILFAHNNILRQNAYYALSNICALQNEKRLALSFLEQVLEKESIGIEEVKMNTNFSHLQEDEDFKILLGKYESNAR